MLLEELLVVDDLDVRPAFNMDDSKKRTRLHARGVFKTQLRALEPPLLRRIFTRRKDDFENVSPL